MKTSHNRANKQRKRNKIANKIFLLVLLLIFGFFGYKYINSRPAEYSQMIPKNTYSEILMSYVIKLKVHIWIYHKQKNTKISTFYL